MQKFHFDHEEKVLKLAFLEPVSYGRTEGVRTPIKGKAWHIMARKGAGAATEAAWVLHYAKNWLVRR